MDEFCAADVDSIFADAGDGNDRVTIDSSIHKPATILGGSGDDTISGNRGGPPSSKYRTSSAPR